uniref:probable C->U-editing enzyme APOBEC-2 n=1 Tax=Oncorhynchus gorbuscha TaxID=8017 RepID=UPI001EAF1384|nr:probable C->U-editing enzyme APOBEC-2 [Oncorhynchus gorbuscha]
MADVLRLRKNLRLYLLMSRLFLWEEPEIKVGLRCLASLGVRIRMMKPSDFLSVWETFVEKEEDMTFNPWEDCQDNYQYYQYRLNTILKCSQNHFTPPHPDYNYNPIYMSSNPIYTFSNPIYTSYNPIYTFSNPI